MIKAQKKSDLDILRLKERRADFQLELKNHFESLDIENADVATPTLISYLQQWHRQQKKQRLGREKIRKNLKKTKGLKS